MLSSTTKLFTDPKIGMEAGLWSGRIPSYMGSHYSWGKEVLDCLQYQHSWNKRTSSSTSIEYKNTRQRTRSGVVLSL